MSPDDLLRPGEVAALLRVSTETLLRLGDQGRIAYVMAHPWSTQRRYTRAEVDRVLALSQQPDPEVAP